MSSVASHYVVYVWSWSSHIRRDGRAVLCIADLLRHTFQTKHASLTMPIWEKRTWSFVSTSQIHLPGNRKKNRFNAARRWIWLEEVSHGYRSSESCSTEMNWAYARKKSVLYAVSNMIRWKVLMECTHMTHVPTNWYELLLLVLSTDT